MSLRLKRIDEANLRAAAELATRKLTCEGCAWLGRNPRPMCKGEDSPHYRQVRDTYHERCAEFSASAVPKVKEVEKRVRSAVIRR